MRFPRFSSSKRATRVSVTLYSKADCPLCQNAERNVRRVFGSRRVDVVDIIGNRVLEDEYVFRIPVLVIEGTVVAEGQITVSDALAARTALEPSVRLSEPS